MEAAAAATSRRRNGGRRLFVPIALVVTLAAAGPARASGADSAGESQRWQQSLDDAWWTGPLLTPGAETLARGRAVTEPYLFDGISAGKHHPGSIAYLLYGLTDSVMLGVRPAFAFGADRPDRRPMLGDWTLMGRLRLTHFTAAHRVPTISVALIEQLPTGRFDRLERPGQGQGSGSLVTLASLNFQYYFRLHGGRLLRARLDLVTGLAREARIRDRSVYGTRPGFAGWAQPGPEAKVEAAAEYSIAKRWAAALDLLYESEGRTRIQGRPSPGAAVESSIIPGNRGFTLAPAIEYSWDDSHGMLLGIRIIPRQARMRASVTPAIAFDRSW